MGGSPTASGPPSIMLRSAQDKTLSQALGLKEEEQLLRRLQRGDRAAFQVLYEAFSARLYRSTIYPRVGLEDVAEDILRETFLTAFEKIGKVRWQERSLFYWLSRIAFHKVADFHRANKRTERFVQGFQPYIEMARPTPANPEECFLSAENLQSSKVLVKRLLGQLNPRYRRAVELRFFEGVDRETCAREMKVSMGNFDVILFRALKRIKALHGRLQDEKS